MQCIGSLREWVVLHTVSCSLTLLLGGGPLGSSEQLEGRAQTEMSRLANISPTGLHQLKIHQEQYWTIASEAGATEGGGRITASQVGDAGKGY